jgi:DNA polymerase (family 10)
MTNRDIARQLRQTAKLMEILQENPFKVKAYDKGADAIKAYPYPVAQALAQGEALAIEGVGKGIWASVVEMLQTGTSQKLAELKSIIPPGIVELSSVRGIGPKKLYQLWKEAGIDGPDGLLRACEEGTLANLKGFGEKTQAAIYNSILYHAGTKGKIHLNTADDWVAACLTTLRSLHLATRVQAVGDWARNLPEVESLAFVVETEQGSDALLQALKETGQTVSRLSPTEEVLEWKLEDGLRAWVHPTPPRRFAFACIRQSAAEAHWQVLSLDVNGEYESEESAYGSVGLPYLPPEVRDGLGEVEAARVGEFPSRLLERADIRGVIHAHSTYSDGANSLREMAEACIRLGYSYLCITDHSQSAAYAGGLKPDKVRQQHAEIDQLNHELAPFRIFKGIESDILRDGSLDYSPDVLASFDFVIGSIHQHFQMSEAEATERLIRAIQNPYLTILGHPTGRLLLNRAGYPINHRRVIEAAAEYGASIELNCNPWRLDLDWSWLREATALGVPIAISPDAHSIPDLAYVDYGVRVGRKGWLTPSQTLNSRTANELESYFNASRSRA